MEEKKLREVLEKHMKWLRDEEGGERANLYNADLSDANLCHANLYGADLSGANLSGADLSSTNLRSACLSGANLRGAILYYANLHYANLCDADLRYADLYGADLSGTNLLDANLSGAKGVSIPYSCPDFGMFIGWKKANGYIVQLEIPEDAKRLSATGRKCRCDKAKVLSIQNLDGSIPDVMEVASSYKNTFIYRVGEIVSVDDFDEDRWNECSTGIHFFINRQEAVDY